MYSLRKFDGRTGSLGTALPDPFDMFGEKRVKFRRGGTSLIAGAPGSFKSVLALNILTKWAPGNSILYFSADSDEFTVAKRLSGILTGDSNETVEVRMQDPAWRRHYQERLSTLNNAKFVYRHLDLEVIENHLGAFEAINGCYPDVVFVDNLIDAVDDPTDWGGMIDFIKQCDILSRKKQCHVCILHHASEAWAQGNPGVPPPSSYIQGKVNQIPRLVLTTAARSTMLNIACVKNTNGPMFPNAGEYMSFSITPSLRVEPFEYAGSVNSQATL